MATATLRGMMGFGLALAPAGVVYALRNGGHPGVELSAVAPPFLTMTLGGGAAVGLCVALAVGLADRYRPDARLATVTAAALGGAVGGVAPGWMAVAHFGAMPAPYMGSVTIALGVVTALVLTAHGLIRAFGPPDARAARCAVAPLLILALPAALACLPGSGWLVLDRVRPVVAAVGFDGLGCLAGALAGALGGLYAGAGLAVARWDLARPKSAALPARLSG